MGGVVWGIEVALLKRWRVFVANGCVWVWWSVTSGGLISD